MGLIIPEFFSFLRAMVPDVSSEMWLFFFLIIMLAGEWQGWERSPLQSSQLAFCTILALTPQDKKPVQAFCHPPRTFICIFEG